MQNRLVFGRKRNNKPDKEFQYSQNFSNSIKLRIGPFVNTAPCNSPVQHDATMFKRRDFPPVLLLSTLILLVILTLSQILVVHNGTIAKNRLSMRKLQIEMRELDFALHSMMKDRVPSMELNRRLLQNEINAHKFQHILQEASKTGIDHIDHKNNSLLLNGDKRTSLPVTGSRKGKNVTSVSHHLNGGRMLSRGENERGINPLNSNGARTSETLIPKQSRTLSSKRRPHGSQTLLLSQSNTPLNARLAGSLEGALTHTNHSSDWGAELSKRGNSTEIGRGLSGHDTDRNSTQTSPVPSAREPVNHKAIVSYCPAIPPHLKGTVPIDFDKALASGDEDIVNVNPGTGLGGRWHPSGCVARHRVAVVIPYRDRRQHLYGLLYYLHPMLQKQQLDYTIFVVEQEGNDTFNKATLMNIAFTEGLKIFPFQCVLFHDVDLVPENDRNMYSCPQQPRHLSVAIDEMGYKLAYPELVGGVLNMRTEHFQRVNGYSNLYWGWGAEDDDMAYRILQVGLKITRPPGTIARYKMIKHKKREPANWKKRVKLLITGPKRFQFDGLNSLNYDLVRIEKRPVFTHILVNIGKPPRGFS